MPKRKKKTIAQQLDAAQLAISNTLADPDILTAVAKFGYTETELAAAQDLHRTAQSSVNLHIALLGDKSNASKDATKKEAVARQEYQDAVDVARANLKSDGIKTLGIKPRQPKRTDDFIYAGYTLFDNAASSGLLAPRGYDAARILEGRKAIEKYDAAHQLQKAATGAAEKATQDQKEALGALNAWLAEYLKIARVALRGDKQLLEKIGIKARTTKTKAQRAAPAKARQTRLAKKNKTT
jgi:hypothetical protein